MWVRKDLCRERSFLGGGSWEVIGSKEGRREGLGGQPGAGEHS